MWALSFMVRGVKVLNRSWFKIMYPRLALDDDGRRTTTTTDDGQRRRRTTMTDDGRRPFCMFP